MELERGSVLFSAGRRQGPTRAESFTRHRARAQPGLWLPYPTPQHFWWLICTPDTSLCSGCSPGCTHIAHPSPASPTSLLPASTRGTETIPQGFGLSPHGAACPSPSGPHRSMDPGRIQPLFSASSNGPIKEQPPCTSIPYPLSFPFSQGFPPGNPTRGPRHRSPVSCATAWLCSTPGTTALAPCSSPPCR